MFGEDMIEDSKIEFKKGDAIQSRYSGRKGKILDLSIDQIHATIRWDSGAEQKVTTGQLIKFEDPRYKTAAGQNVLMAFDDSLRVVVGDQAVESTPPEEVDEFSSSELLEIGDLMRKESMVSVSPKWIKEELIRRGYNVE